MPRHTSLRRAERNKRDTRPPENLNEAIKAVRLDIEREKLCLLKAKTADIPARLKGTRAPSLDERLKGYAPTHKELEHMKADLAQKYARMSLNDSITLEKMLAHRRENGCNDIDLLEAELQLHYAALVQRIKDNKNAYGDQAP